MKPVLMFPLLGWFALAFPAVAQNEASGVPADHHDLPEGPDPFTQMAPQGYHQMEQVPGACREPGPPLSDPASLERLGLTLSQEYDRYFSDATRYFMCLDQTRADFFQVVKQHGIEYRKLLQR
ncbi:hypothetical protein [Paracoccus beibuensis]|uniref:hypothetical protein n=1 Tax=Paracoccus beibuensis TaxID=547602 RepID=UPI00223EFE1A|nr:hypothetical protein [Paracoccus beibuensis]